MQDTWWADTIKNPKDIPDFGCRWLAGSEKPDRLVGLWVPMVGGQR